MGAGRRLHRLHAGRAGRGRPAGARDLRFGLRLEHRQCDGDAQLDQQRQPAMGADGAARHARDQRQEELRPQLLPDTWACGARRPSRCRRSRPTRSNRTPYDVQDPHFTIAAVSVPGAATTASCSRRPTPATSYTSELRFSNSQPQARCIDPQGTPVLLTSPTALVAESARGGLVHLGARRAAAARQFHAWSAAPARPSARARCDQMLIGMGFTGYYPARAVQRATSIRSSPARARRRRRNWRCWSATWAARRGSEGEPAVTRRDLRSRRRQQRDVAARRRRVDGERLFGAEAVQVMRAAGLGAGARQALAAERLHADHGADHVAVDVDVADVRAARPAPGRGCRCGSGCPGSGRSRAH